MVNFDELKKEYKKLSLRLSSPELSFNGKEYGEISKRFTYLQKIVENVNEKQKIEKSIKENEELLSDDGMRALAEEEIKKLKKEKLEIEKKIEKIEKEKSSSVSGKEVLVEIRAGAGGDEAALFSKNLFEMYQKFSQKMNWDLIILDSNQTDLNGLKSISFEVKGRCPGEYLKYESGVHRVQRIPETEKMGRVHTSTASVAVLPKAKPKDIEIKPNEIKMETCKSSAPGGQNVNKRETAARITHLPTGIVVASQTTRTLAQNRENAMALLRSQLLAKKIEKEEGNIKEKRKTQIGGAKRAEKIRTYNFPQDRITDHRIKKSWGNIEEILEGNLDKITNDLKKFKEKIEK